MTDREHLEAFVDGDLPPLDAARLGDRLRREPTLRAHLAEILRLDALARQALLSTSPAPARPRPLALPHWRWAAGAVAAILLLAGLAILRWPFGGSAPEPLAPERLTHTAAKADPAPPPLTVVARLRAPAGSALAAMFEPAPHTPELDEALNAGDAHAARASIREGLSRDEAQALADRLASAIRSARTAHEALDGLTADEQLALCDLWARDPRWRPVAFERLARLKTDDAMHARVISLANTLALEPGLASWVRSYRLTEA